MNSYYNTPASDIFRINAPAPSVVPNAVIAQVSPDPATTITEYVDPNAPKGPPAGNMVEALKAPAGPEIMPLPLNETYINNSGVPSVDANGKMTGKNSIGWLNVESVRDEQGNAKPKASIYFNKELLLPNEKGEVDQTAVQRSRMLVLMKKAIDSGHIDNIEPSQEERTQAQVIWGNAMNRPAMSAIARAYALVNRTTNIDYTGPVDENVNGWETYFNEKHHITPTTFMVNGDIQSENDTEDSPLVSLSKKRDEQVKIAASQIPDLPAEIDEQLISYQSQIDANTAKMTSLAKKLKVPGYAKTTPGAADVLTLKELTQKNASIATAVSAAQARIAFQKERVQTATANRAGTGAIIASLNDTIKQEETEARAERDNASVRRTMIGSNPGDSSKYMGMVSAAFLEDPRLQGFTKKEPILDQKTGQPTGAYRRIRINPLQVPEFLTKGKNYGKLASLTNAFGDEKVLFDKEKGVDAQQRAYNESLDGLQALMAANKKIMDVEKKNGVLASSLYKTFYNDDLLATSGQTQRSLVGKIRVAFEGPGKMSNFEFQQLLENIPNPTDKFQVTSRVSARIKAMALINASNLIVNQVQNGIKPTGETYRRMNEQLAEILNPDGKGKVLTPHDFKNFVSQSIAMNATYANTKGDRQRDVGLKHLESVYDMLGVAPADRK